jgi:thiamine biosynthesis lipoprotein
VYKLNNSSTNTDIEFSSHGIEVFTLAKNLYKFTDKKFNPAIFPLVKLWQFDDYNYPIQNFTPPSEQAILSCLGENTDFDKIIVNLESDAVCKTADSVKVDFGGILKGYAVDKAKDILVSAGHKSGYINIGGSSLYLLSVNSLSIRHPRAINNLSNIISVNGNSLTMKAVSTSGDYEKYHENNGVRYSHIISPLTGYPTTTGVISATIIGTSGAFGDAVTTALCLMEHEHGKTDSELVSFMNKIIADYPDCIIFAVYNNGDKKEIVTNKMQGEHFTLLDSSYSINKI